jgi:hypothetical protein
MSSFQARARRQVKSLASPLVRFGPAERHRLAGGVFGFRGHFFTPLTSMTLSALHLTQL